MATLHAGQHRHHNLLQRVLHSQICPITSNGQHAPAVSDSALRPKLASRDVLRPCAEEVSSRTCKEAPALSAPIAALGWSAAHADNKSAAQHASVGLDSHEMLCSDLQPRQPIAMRPFHRQQDGPAADYPLSAVGPMLGMAYKDTPHQDPQLDALLHDVQAQPSDVPLAPWCAQSWQDPPDSPADSCSSQHWHSPVSLPMLAKEPGLADRSQSSEVLGMPAACLLKALQNTQPGREAVELRAHETCAAKHSRADRSSCEAAGAAETDKAHGAANVGEDIQGPSTPGGRPGNDSAQQEGSKRMQQPGMASLLQQDIASLRGQVGPPAHSQDDLP